MEERMQSDKKMIFFDIDGTLVTEGTHIIPESTKKAIRLARENGHLTFINTGRTHFNIDNKVRNLGFDGYVCGCGTYIYYHDKLLFSSTIPHAECLRLIQLMRECELTVFFEENSNIFLDELSPYSGKEITDARAMFGARGIDCLPFDLDESFTFDKLLVFFHTRSNKKAFLEGIKENYTFIDRGRQTAEIIQKSCSKATGIQFFMDYLGIPLENCYAIGDSTNDLSMLQFVPNSIAMGNSMKEILPYCAYQTTDILDDGIYRALEHFGIV